MPDRHDHDRHMELSRFWNELTETGDSTTPIDRETASLIRRLHTSANAPLPGSARERVWRSLLESYDKPVTGKEPTMHTATNLIRPGLNGRAISMRPRPLTDRLPRPADHRLLLAAAVLVVAILGGIAGAIIANRLDSNDPGPAPAILAPGTPSPEAEATDETLVEVPLPPDILPPGESGTAVLGDITVPVGTFGYPTPLASPGVMAGYVLEGTITVISDGVLQVIWADGDGVVEEIQPGIEIVLDPGDTLITRHSPGEAWTNEGPGEVRLIAMEFFPRGMFEPNTLPNGWNIQGGEGTAPESIAQPEAPTVMKLRRVAVPANGVLVPPADATVFLVRPENGASIGRASDGSVTIVGGQATTALIMTIEPADDAATPIP